jgi:HSP20 family protein
LSEQIVCKSGRSDVRNMLMFTDCSHLICIETAHSDAILKRDHWFISIFSGILLPLAGFGSDVMTPKIDIAETKDAIDLAAELPGVDEKDLDVTLADGILTIRGEKKTARDERDKDKNWHVVERSYGSFSRAITLPFDPDPGEVEAKFDKGVLHIHLPKPAEMAKKQQKIEIKKA